MLSNLERHDPIGARQLVEHLAPQMTKINVPDSGTSWCAIRCACEILHARVAIDAMPPRHTIPARRMPMLARVEERTILACTSAHVEHAAVAKETLQATSQACISNAVQARPLGVRIPRAGFAAVFLVIVHSHRRCHGGTMFVAYDATRVIIMINSSTIELRAVFDVSFLVPVVFQRK